MGAVILGPGRAEELGLDVAKIEARSKKNKKLDKKVNQLSIYMAEGWTMTEGFPSSGTELAYMFAGAIDFAIASLMEQGYLAKRLPVVKDDPETEGDKRGYL